MRLSSDDEHVSIYGRLVNQKNGSQLLLKGFTGIYGLVDQNGLGLVGRNPPGGIPYPCLSVQKLIKAFTDEHSWQIDTLKISNVQLVGNRWDFLKLASCIADCHTLKTIILGDSRTSLVRDEATSVVSGFDAVVCALRNAPQLQEVSLQNMEEISSDALGELCQSTSIEKLQLFLSQSLFPAGGISGDYLHTMAQRLQANHTLKELRIIGVLDEDACRALSEMLLVNNTLQKIAVKIKIRGGNQAEKSPLPFLAALESPSCSLTSLELYLSGRRQALEECCFDFRDALKANQSLKQLSVTFYGLDFQGRGGVAAIRTNELWMSRMEETLEHNYMLRQVMINHGLLELSDKLKFYLRLNRAGRKSLLKEGSNNQGEEDQLSELNLWVETLEKVKNDISCLFYIVSCAPTMLCGERDISLTSREGASLPLKRKR